MYCLYNDCPVDEVIDCSDTCSELGVMVCENCSYCVPDTYVPLYPEENPRLAKLIKIDEPIWFI